MTNTHVLKAPNGLTFIISVDQHAVTASIDIYIGVGSAVDTVVQRRGLAHVLEHMLFRGTRTRTAFDLFQGFFRVGSKSNAETDFNRTDFYATVPPADLAVPLELYVDMLFHSKIDPRDLETEKGAVISELEENKSNPETFIVDYMLRPNVLRNYPCLTTDPLGRVDEVKAINSAALRAYLDVFYKPANMVVSINSALPADAVMRILSGSGLAQIQSGRDYYQPLVDRDKTHPAHQDEWTDYLQYKRAFSASLQQRYAQTCFFQRPPAKDIQPQLNFPSPAQLVRQSRDISQAYIAIGYEALPFGEHVQHVGLDLLGIVLAGGPVSRLWLLLREQYGLVYFVHYTIERYHQTGMFYVLLGTASAAQNLQRVVELVAHEVQRLVQQPVTAQELTSAQEFVRSREMLQRADSMHAASDNGLNYIMIRQLFAPQQLLDTYASYNSQSLQRLAASFFGQRPATVAILSGRVT